MNVNVELLRKEYQVYSFKDLVIKYQCAEQELKSLIRKNNITFPRFVFSESWFIQNNYMYMSDQGLAHLLGKTEQMITEFRMRAWLLKKAEWTKGRVIIGLRKLDKSGRCLSLEYLSHSHPEIYENILHQFDSLENALSSANIDSNYHIKMAKVIAENYFTSDKIKSAILELAKDNKPLQYSFVLQYNRPLLTAASDKRFFGSWGKALESCGFHYQDIKLNKQTEQYRGYFFEALVRESLACLGWNLGRPSEEENPENLNPDFYNCDNKEWIDAKLRPWSQGVEDTLKKYLCWAPHVQIIYLEGEQWSETKQIETFKNATFTPIDHFYDQLYQRDKEYLVDEFEALKSKEKMTHRFQEFIEKAQTRYNEVVEQGYQKKSGYIGTYKPMVFIDDHANAVFNADVTQDDIGLKRGWFREDFKNVAVYLVQEIVLNNRRFFFDMETDITNRINIREFIKATSRKYNYQIKYKPETIINLGYRLTFAYRYRIYRVNYFLQKQMPSDNSFFNKREIMKKIEEIIENDQGKIPIADLQIMKILNIRGFKIARRTVSKYRAQMGIETSSRRKQSLE